MLSVGITCGLIVLLLLLYRYLTATFNFWKERNVPGPDPVPLFGTMKKVFLWKEFTGIYLKRIYDAYEDAQFVGLFNMREPELLIKDSKHIKDVLIKDASIFFNRGLPFYPNAEPLQQFLFFLDGSLAHSLRTHFSAAFTPTKLREMFFIMQEINISFENYMDALLLKSDYVNCSDVSFRLFSDMIGRSVLGVDMNSLSTKTNETNALLNIGENTQDTKTTELFKNIMRNMYPALYNIIGRYLFHNTANTKLFIDFTNDLLEQRRKDDIVKSDFLGLLLKLKNNPKKLNEETGVTDQFLAAQVFGFFYAGVEPSATIKANMLYELALNQTIQDKVRKEIRNFYAKNGGLTYDNINSMPYLNAVIKETIRKYPPVHSLQRKSTSTYTFRDTKLTIPKGQKVVIPVYAIHHDPKIYPKPDVYDPERFTDEAAQAKDPMHHIRFGYGIRNCLGERAGGFQLKLALVAFIRKYKVEICEKTFSIYKHRIAFSLVVSTPEDPIYLKVTKLDAC